MPTTKKQKLRNKLMAKLTELFQLDQPELDFGFYRIMHAKAQQVKSFIDKDLLQIIEGAFGQVDEGRKGELAAAVGKAIQTAKDFGAPNPEETEPVKKAKAALEALHDGATAESDVYDHLYRFFERYYDRFMFLRKSLGYTQQVMAKEIDTSPSYISDIEKGKATPGGKFLFSLKRKVGASIDWLLTGEGEMFATSNAKPDIKSNNKDIDKDIEEITEKIRQKLKIDYREGIGEDEFSELRKQLPELKELAALVKEDPKRATIIRRYLYFAHKHREVVEGLDKLTNKQFEEKIEAVLRLLAT